MGTEEPKEHQQTTNEGRYMCIMYIIMYIHERAHNVYMYMYIVDSSPAQGSSLFLRNL